MQLREYQIKLKREIYQAWQEGATKVLAQLPTGGGKSCVLSSIVKDAEAKGYEVLVMAHRHELLEQLQGTLRRYEIFSGLIKSGYPYTPMPVQVASVQTMAKRLEKIELNPKLIVYDEAHHCTASTYRKILDFYPNAKVLGMTATPCRTDGKGLGDIFEVLVKGATIPELVELGSLVPPTYYVSRSVIFGLPVRTSGGDYHLGDLGNAVRESRIEGDLVREWKEKAEDLQTIVFAVNVEHSIEIVKKYREAGIPSHHLDCSIPPIERKAILSQFATGKIKVLSNVGIVSEGFDVPACSCVQIARPTKSLSLYFQMIGRALRPLKGKSEAIVLDHGGVYVELGCVMAPINWHLNESKPVKNKEAQPDWIVREPREIPVLGVNEEEILIKVELGADSHWVLELQKLVALQKKRGYKALFVAHKLREKYLLTEDQWKQVGKVLGFKRGWAAHFMAQ